MQLARPAAGETSPLESGAGKVRLDFVKSVATNELSVSSDNNLSLLPLTMKEYLRLHLSMIIKAMVVVLVATLILTLVGVQSIEVDACNSTAASGEQNEDDVSGVSSYVGIGIACVANAFNGGGMSLQKVLRRTQTRTRPKPKPKPEPEPSALGEVGHNRVAAAAGGIDVNSVGHFKQPMWWLGLVMIVMGEGGNAFAYGLAPASTVAPFGGIGVFTNYVIAVMCLGEKSSAQSILGICFIAAGVVLTTLAVPESSVAYTAHELLSDQAYLSHRAFWYIIATIVVVLIIAIKLEKDYADRYIYVWAVYASIVSSWTVIACRGLFSMIAQVPFDCSNDQQCFHDELHWRCQSTIGHWLFWLSAVVIGATACAPTPARRHPPSSARPPARHTLAPPTPYFPRTQTGPTA